MIYPNMHESFRQYLTFLADSIYQDRVWINKDFSGDIVSFDDIVHFIFDDTGLADDADDCVGWYLRDANEAAHVRKVVAAIDAVLNKYGNSLTDAQYTTKPEWQDVLKTAKAALAVMSAPDEAASKS